MKAEVKVTIPKGWRRLEASEELKRGDRYLCIDRWVQTGNAGFPVKDQAWKYYIRRKAKKGSPR